MLYKIEETPNGFIIKGVEIVVNRDDGYDETVTFTDVAANTEMVGVLIVDRERKIRSDFEESCHSV